MKKFILAEKPSLAMTIVRAIGNMKKCDGYFENDNYIVSFAFGHLLTLNDIDDYLNRDKTTWSIEELPFIPEEFKFKIRKDSGVKKQYNLIKEIVKRDDVNILINCGDADREGEVIINNIFYRIFKEENFKKAIKRLWLPEQTEEMIIEGLSNLKDISHYENLYKEGLARTYTDWLLGINLSRFVTLKSKTLLPVGRVLIPVVKFIYDRDLEIKNFNPKKYFEIEGNIEKEGQEIKCKVKELVYQVKEYEKAKRKLEELKKEKAIVKNVDIKEVKKQPPKLFSLDTLQNKLSSEKGFSLNKTLEIAQKLYEKGYISYPRTNTEYLSEEEKYKIDKIINCIKENDNIDISLKESKKIFDSSKIESHSCITPTLKIPEENKLQSDELIVYKTIKNRFISNFLNKDTIIEETIVNIFIGDEKVILKGNVIKEEGFLIFENNNKKEKEIPKFLEGEELNIDLFLEEKETQKPKKVTEEELNKYLKSPYKKTDIENILEENDDEEYKNILEGVEIGTVATRADIIEKAKKYEYIKSSGKSLICCEKGIHLIQVLNELNIDLSKDKTVEIGRILKKIYKKEKNIEDIIEISKNYLKEVIEKGKEIEVKSFKIDKEVIGKCPLCGNDVIKNKKAFGCSNWKNGCKFTIWGIIAGKKITDNQAKDLLIKGKTNKIKGFKSKKGSKFDAYLKLEDGLVKFQF